MKGWRFCSRLSLLVAGVLGLTQPALVQADAGAAPQWQFVHNAPEAADDHRYDYHWRVLRAALEATRQQYGGYSVTPGAEVMSERLQVVEMQRVRGGLNTLVLNTTSALEQSLLPVRIPIDKGLLGFRVFLIQAADQPRFSAVHSLDDLRQFSFGQGHDWSDVAVYQDAGLKVVTGRNYEGLFRMLMARRFDAFGRGISEVTGELAHWHKQYPQMVIENELLLYYPLPVYFWFSSTEEGRLRAQRVAQGMRTIIADGSFERLFQQEYGATIAAMQLNTRRVLTITNPNIPPGQPFAIKAYWFEPGIADF